MDLKQLFSEDDSWDVHGFTFRMVEKSFSGEEKRVFYAGVGVDDSFSKGYSIEIDNNGTLTVFNLETKIRCQVVDDPKWSYTELVALIKHYEQITHDVRDSRA
jgi:hypothetical protein